MSAAIEITLAVVGALGAVIVAGALIVGSILLTLDTKE